MFARQRLEQWHKEARWLPLVDSREMTREEKSVEPRSSIATEKDPSKVVCKPGSEEVLRFAG